MDSGHLPLVVRGSGVRMLLYICGMFREMESRALLGVGMLEGTDISLELELDEMIDDHP